MAAYGYVRVSTSEQAGDDRTSLDTQRRKIGAVVELAGLTLARVFEEPGMSGGTVLAERPAGRDLLAVLRPGDTVIVSKLDRAFRNAADALAMAEVWKRSGVDLIVADMGSEPVTQDGVSRMFFGMLALVAEFERDRIKERSAEGRAAKRRAGGHIGGSTPFGYRKIGAGRAARLELDPAQQEAVATIRALAAEGMASRAIAAAVRERHGLAVSHVTVRAALARAGGRDITRHCPRCSLSPSTDSEAVEAMEEAADRYQMRFGMPPPAFEFTGWYWELARELDAAVARGEPVTTEDLYRRLGLTGLPPDVVL